MDHQHKSAFPHNRLLVYRYAQDLVVLCDGLTATLPRGYADLRDQARRAALATVRHVAEAASRTSTADKRARFTVARGEVAELEATIASAVRLGIAGRDVAQPLFDLSNEVGAMLYALIKRKSYPNTTS